MTLRGKDFDITDELKEITGRIDNLRKTKSQVDSSKFRIIIQSICSKRFLRPFFIVGPYKSQ